MRSFAHLTPRYIKSRIATNFYEKKNPNSPWLTRSANEILASYLTKSDIGLEFGSGRSTVWFAQHVGRLTSVEHDASWAANVIEMLKQSNLANVEYKHLARNKEDCDGGTSAYVNVAHEFDNDSLDFCLVDGIYREFCALSVIAKLRPGGVLVIDNVNWYLPSNSHSPDSRTLAEGPDGPVWKEFDEQVAGWRKIWTSTGVTDTALFFKPCASVLDSTPTSAARLDGHHARQT